jgi:hypothetical protein
MKPLIGINLDIRPGAPQQPDQLVLIKTIA